MKGENVEVTQTFTYLGNVHSSTSCKLEINRRLGRAWSAVNLLDKGLGAASLSLADPSGLAVYILDSDRDSDRRARMQTALLWYHVVPPNL